MSAVVFCVVKLGLEFDVGSPKLLGLGLGVYALADPPFAKLVRALMATDSPAAKRQIQNLGKNIRKLRDL